MPDLYAPAPRDAETVRPTSAPRRHTWLHTIELGLLFLVLAILADVIGTAHDQRTTLVGQRGPSATREAAPRDTLARERRLSATARPATPG